MNSADSQRRLECLEYARQASRKARLLTADDPQLAELMRRIAGDRQRQVQRLQRMVAEQAEPAEPPAPGAAVVESVNRITPDLIRLRLRRPAQFDFRAGQHVKLRVDGVSRTYSIASAPAQPELEFFIELHAGGAMSERLRPLRPGDAVELGRASGKFQLGTAHRRHLLVATVTGIAPFVSLLADALPRGDDDEFHLLHGASYSDEFGYADDVGALMERYAGRVFYTPTVSRPAEPRNAGWQGATGRVETLIEPYLRQHAMTPDDTVIYACGHPEMVANVYRQWSARDFEVRVEPY